MVRERGRRALPFKSDVTDFEAVQAMFKSVIEEWKRLDILVNNAGYAQPISALEMSVQDWERMLAVDLKARSSAAGGGAVHDPARRRQDLNIASMSSFHVNRDADYCHYNAAKAGVVMLTKSLAVEWARYKIYVNAISPGYCRTPGNAARSDNPAIRPSAWTRGDQALRPGVRGSGAPWCTWPRTPRTLRRLQSRRGRRYSL